MLASRNTVISNLLSQSWKDNNFKSNRFRSTHSTHEVFRKTAPYFLPRFCSSYLWLSMFVSIIPACQVGEKIIVLLPEHKKNPLQKKWRNPVLRNGQWKSCFTFVSVQEPERFNTWGSKCANSTSFYRLHCKVISHSITIPLYRLTIWVVC